MSDSLINNIDKLSEPVTKLIEVTSAGIGKLYHPLGTVRQAKADAKAKIIIAKADAEIAELNKRANERVEHREMLRQNNIENVVSIAANEMPTEVSENPVDVDWTLQFFDAAQDVCDNDMQLLWARILAGEVSEPGSFSKRTLQFLKTLDKFEAEKFVDFCSFVLQFETGQCFIIDNDATRSIMRNKAGNYDLFSHFNSIGLVGEPLFGDSKFDEKQATYFGQKYTYVAQNKPDLVTGKLSHIFGYRCLTQLGQQLFTIANAEPVENYITCLSEQLEKDCKIALIKTIA
ncbi:DUF2806 domain-containing protein [Vibrio harveyi]